MNTIKFCVCCLWLALASGCGLRGGLTVDGVMVRAQKPSNVALFVAVSERGQSVLGLGPENFRVIENGVVLDSRQIGLTLLPTRSAVARRALVLVDMSRTQDGEQRATITEALRAFVSKIRQRQSVSVYAFDGAEHIHFISDYARDARAEPDERDTSLDKLLAFSKQDSSSNLYGAILDAGPKLEAELEREKAPVGIGSLIVIAQNPDLAGRVSEDQLRAFLDHASSQLYLVMVGPWSTANDVSFIGKNGVTRAGSVGTLASPLATLADSIEDASFRHYLVSYCSPARAGTRRVELEVTATDEQGKQSLGSYETEFDATGFGPGCDPQAPPHFVASATRAERMAKSSP